MLQDKQDIVQFDFICGNFESILSTVKLQAHRLRLLFAGIIVQRKLDRLSHFICTLEILAQNVFDFISKLFGLEIFGLRVSQ